MADGDVEMADASEETANADERLEEAAAKSFRLDP